VVYLFLDAIYLAVRQGTDEQEGVLCAYGILESGQKVLLHLALGSRESYDAWLSFLHDLTARGLEAPWLVISDGQPGLRKALREVFPRAFHQRCQVHKMRNILAKLPQAARALLKPLIQQVFRAATYEQGLARGRALIARWRARYPAAMAYLEQDLEACLVYLKCPREHHKSIRTTNLLERTFGEGRRRTTVSPRFPTCLPAGRRRPPV
jgi:transposase-like protein